MLASPRKGLRAWTGSVATPAQSRQWRFYAESLIERAISILNEIDGDADLEDGGNGSRPSPPLSAEKARFAGVRDQTMIGSFPIMSPHQG